MRARLADIDVAIHRVDGELSSARHRIARVHGKVDEHLCELPGIRANLSELRVERDGHCDVLADETSKDLLRLADHRVHIEHARLQHLLAAEREQLLRE